MASHGKALLVLSKALPANGSKTYDQAMLSTSELLAQKLAQALKEKGLTQSELAALCGESKQTVYSWKKTGRIDKKHLQKFVEIFGHPLQWWFGVHVPQPAQKHMAGDNDAAPYHLNRWPFASVSQKEWASLSERQAGLVEGYIKGILAEEPPVKSNGTNGHL